MGVDERVDEMARVNTSVELNRLNYLHLVREGSLLIARTGTCIFPLQSWKGAVRKSILGIMSSTIEITRLPSTDLCRLACIVMMLLFLRNARICSG